MQWLGNLKASWMSGAVAALGIASVVSADAASASTGEGDVCDRAAAAAASETGVPLSVLQSITRVETGRTRAGELVPWPWTVNMEGKGRWFDDPRAAVEYARDHRRSGARSFDVGCFQINFRWHSDEFSSLANMFEPSTNALYAARFLKRLFRETGDWVAAAGAYHSRTPKFARIYEKRFTRIYYARRNTDVPTTPRPLQRQVRLESGSRDREPGTMRAISRVGPSRLGSLAAGWRSDAAPLISRASALR